MYQIRKGYSDIEYNANINSSTHSKSAKFFNKMKLCRGKISSDDGMAGQYLGCPPGIPNSYIGTIAKVCPADQLVFHVQDETVETLDYLTIVSLTDVPLAFRIKTTSPDCYRVKPSQGIIQPEANEMQILVHLQPGCYGSVGTDKFLVMCLALKDMEIANAARMGEIWNKPPLDKYTYMERKLSCTLTVTCTVPPKTSCPTPRPCPTPKPCLQIPKPTSTHQGSTCPSIASTPMVCYNPPPEVFFNRAVSNTPSRVSTGNKNVKSEFFPSCKKSEFFPPCKKPESPIECKPQHWDDLESSVSRSSDQLHYLLDKHELTERRLYRLLTLQLFVGLLIIILAVIFVFGFFVSWDSYPSGASCNQV